MISKWKLQLLRMTGRVVSVTMTPENFGGDPQNPHNILWLYKAAAGQKQNFDSELKRIVNQRGGEWKYSARTSYEENSLMPEQVTVKANSLAGDVLEMVIENEPDADPAKMPVFTAGSAGANNAQDNAGGKAAFEALFLQHAAASLDKQLQIADFVGEGWSWQIDTETGTLALTMKDGRQAEVPIQVLGSESQISNTWLWAWANKESNLPPNIVTSAENLRHYGEENHISQFTEAKLPLHEITGELISMVAAGMSNAGGYFRGPYQGGAVFLLIEQMPALPQPPHPLSRITAVFPQLTAGYSISNHMAALQAYARYYGFDTKVEGNRLNASHPQFGELVADFDEAHRMTNLQSTMKPLQPSF